MNSSAAPTSFPLYATKRPKLALIAEGGGQRGIFTAGVLDAWLEAGYDLSLIHI